MRNRRKTASEVLKLIIDKELEPYGVTKEFVTENVEIEGAPWYEYYTFNSEEEYNNWKKFSIELIAKEIQPRNKKVALKEFVMLDLMWGLKHNYKEKE
jgi:hypothetical protein